MDLKLLLDKKYREYNSIDFIEKDPISIPHSFRKLQDIEIMGFWTAMLSWGQRKTIISKSRELSRIMEEEPYNFILSLKRSDILKFSGFKHRTFNYTDTEHFLRFFHWYYSRYESLEEAFVCNELSEEPMATALEKFHQLFFSLDNSPQRTTKHVSTPARGSTCKRLNMFLRWMVRKEGEIDFGLWKRISPADLLCPLDVHVDRIGRKFGLIKRKQTDWQTVLELTNNLRKFDPYDPVKYDIALFGMSTDELISKN